MTSLNRRGFVAAGAASLAGTAFAQQPGHEHHGGHYERLNQPGRIGKPELAASQNVFDSPAPKATSPGRWSTKALLPLPRSEMAWAAAHDDRMHIVGPRHRPVPALGRVLRHAGAPVHRALRSQPPEGLVRRAFLPELLGDQQHVAARMEHPDISQIGQPRHCICAHVCKEDAVGCCLAGNGQAGTCRRSATAIA